MHSMRATVSPHVMPKFLIWNWNCTVPVVAIFTKFDDLILQVYDRDKDDEESIQIAQTILKEKFEKPLNGYQYPPCAYVQFECMSFLI